MNRSHTSWAEAMLKDAPVSRSPIADFVDFAEFDPSSFGELLGLGFNITGNFTKQPDSAFHTAMQYINLYFTPIIIVSGLVGNLLSFLVFTFTHVQRLSASIYLSSLAVADILFLLSLTLVWFDRRLGFTVFATAGWCQAVVYMYHVAGFMAVWNVLSFTAERYIVAYHPLKKDVWCTRKKAMIVVAGLTIFALIFYTYVMWTYDVIRVYNKVACSPMPAHHEVNIVLTNIDTILACVVPSVVIIILNIKIMIKIHEYQKKRSESKTELMNHGIYVRNRSVIHASISTTGSVHIKFSTNKVDDLNVDVQELDSPEVNRCHAAMRVRSQIRTARMLLILSSIFVLLNLPYHIFRVHTFIGNFFGASTLAPRDKRTWDELFQLLYFLNFAINFFIYSACGRQFRVGLQRLTRRWKHKLQSCHQDKKMGRNGNLRFERTERVMLNTLRIKSSK